MRVSFVGELCLGQLAGRNNTPVPGLSRAANPLPNLGCLSEAQAGGTLIRQPSRVKDLVCPVLDIQ